MIHVVKSRRIASAQLFPLKKDTAVVLDGKCALTSHSQWYAIEYFPQISFQVRPDAHIVHCVADREHGVYPWGSGDEYYL